MSYHVYVTVSGEGRIARFSMDRIDHWFGQNRLSLFNSNADQIRNIILTLRT